MQLDARIFGEGLAALVRDQVAKATASLQVEVVALRAELAARPDTKTNSEAIARAVGEAFAALPKLEDGKSVSVEELRPMVDDIVARTVAALPKPIDGASVTLEDVRPVLALLVDAKFATVPVPKAITVDDVRPLIDAEVTRRIAELPKPVDGESVTLDDVRPIIDAEVARRVAEIPKAVDGTSVELDDVLPVIRSEVKAQIADLPKPADGKSVTVAELLPTIKSVVDALPKPDDGKSVTADEVRSIAAPVLERLVAERLTAVDDVRNNLSHAFETLEIHATKLGELRTATDAVTVVADALAAIPAPAEVKSITVDDVRPLIEREVAERVAALPKPADGESIHPDSVRVMVEDAVDAAIVKAMTTIRQPEDGKPADPAEVSRLVNETVVRQFELLRPHIKGEPGDDGLGFDDIRLGDIDDEGVLTITFARGDQVREFKVAGFPHAAGLHVKGKRYRKGAIATYGGSGFQAVRETDAPIGGTPPSPDWRMLVQRGRDAK